MGVNAGSPGLLMRSLTGSSWSQDTMLYIAIAVDSVHRLLFKDERAGDTDSGHTPLQWHHQIIDISNSAALFLKIVKCSYNVFLHCQVFLYFT